MKVGIITFHFVHNCGAMLQCYALQKKVEQLGHEVSIINYRPKYHTSQYDSWQNPFYNYNDSNKGIKCIVRKLIANRHFFSREKQRKTFDQFERFFNTTTPIFTESDWNYFDWSSFDAIICGSDQIWNKALTNNVFDKAYFAIIPEFKGKRNGYAISSGETNLAKERDNISVLMQGMVISAREKKTAESITSICDKFIDSVPDPTLLLEKNDYIMLEKNIDIPKHYILLYALEESEMLHKTIKQLVDKYKLLVINISPGIKVSSAIKSQNISVGPGEFLSCISHADYIVTNSFHGSVFSIIYEKNVLIVSHTKRNGRLENLLHMLGAEDAMVTDSMLLSEKFDKKLDYNKIKEKKDIYIKKGESFIIRALDDPKEV